jgi:hypothetical protein
MIHVALESLPTYCLIKRYGKTALAFRQRTDYTSFLYYYNQLQLLLLIDILFSAEVVFVSVTLLARINCTFSVINSKKQQQELQLDSLDRVAVIDAQRY